MKLKITTNNHSKQSQVVGIRLPLDVIEKLNDIKRRTGWKRKDIITYCIDNLEVEGDK